MRAERAVLANAERLLAASSEAYQPLYEQDGAVLDALATVWKRVGDLAALDPRVAPYARKPGGGRVSARRTWRSS